MTKGLLKTYKGEIPTEVRYKTKTRVRNGAPVRQPIDRHGAKVQIKLNSWVQKLTTKIKNNGGNSLNEVRMREAGMRYRNWSASASDQRRYGLIGKAVPGNLSCFFF